MEYDPQEPPDAPRAALVAIAMELEGRHLNDMIRPARPDQYGLAAWVLDRMIARYKVVRVRVWDHRSSVELEADTYRRR